MVYYRYTWIHDIIHTIPMLYHDALLLLIIAQSFNYSQVHEKQTAYVVAMLYNTRPSNTYEVERTMTMKLYNTDLNALGIQPKTMR